MNDVVRVRRLAAASRAAALNALQERGASATPDAVLEAALELEELEVVRVASGSRLLGSARAKLDRAQPAIILDRALAAESARFSTAHELGHLVVERPEGDTGTAPPADGESDGCAASDLDEAPVADRFPIGEAYVTGYGPRQQREVGASLFAAEFLAPIDVVCDAFLAGRSAREIAADLGVSPTVVHGQLTSGLLHPRPAGDATPAGPVAQLALHPKQRDAREALPGPVAVDAGPGTGKTRTLTERVCYLVNERGVGADDVLGLTFSNKAAEEMASRITRALGRAVRVQTFHAFGLDVLRDYPDQAGVRNDVTLLDAIDAQDLLERHLGELGLDEYRHVTEPGLYLADILSAISRAKDEMVSHERYAQLAVAALDAAADDRARKAARRAAEVSRVYEVYERLLVQHGAVDFGDLIYRVVRLFEAHPEVARAEGARYPHVVVDEYQDVNRASARMLQLLRPDGSGLWVVGDVRQAIYRFRGASPRNFRDFRADFPAAGAPMPLVRNYRSVPALIDVFSSVAHAMTRAPGFADWEPDRERDASGAPAAVFGTATTEAAEVGAMADRILHLHDEGRGRQFGDVAVLCHRNRDVQNIARAFEARGIPVANFGDFFSRLEVQDLLAVLALGAGHGVTALARVGQTAPHTMPIEELRALIAVATDTNGGLPAVMGRTEPPDGVSPATFAAFRTDWQRISAAAFRREVWTFFADYLFEDGRYLRRIAAEPGHSARHQRFALGQLLLLARAFDAREVKVAAGAAAGEPRPEGEASDDGALRERADDPAAGLERKRDFLRFIRRLWASKDRRVAVPLGGSDAVFIGTVHSSKGLEFPVVFVPFLVEGRFPFDPPHDHAPPPPGLVDSFEPDAEKAELEALFFVALTRARDLLVVSHAEDYGGEEPVEPSWLLRLLAPARAAGLLREERWAGGEGPSQVAPSSRLLGAHAPTTLSYSAYTTFRDCPRRYFYRYVLNLPEGADGRAYLPYVIACRATLDWLAETHAAGMLPRAWDAVEKVFAERWAERGPFGHVHEAFYRAEALAFVRAEWERRNGTADAPAWGGEATLEVDGVQVRIPVEATRVDGNAVHVGHRFFRPQNRKKDHLEPRFALLRVAMAGAVANPVVEAHYPQGTVAFGPLRKDHEQKRLDDLREAIARIRTADFPADPKEERERACPRCPYAFVCPA